jgi:hypothetical protein
MRIEGVQKSRTEFSSVQFSSIGSQNTPRRVSSPKKMTVWTVVTSCIKVQWIRSSNPEPVFLVTQTPDTWQYICFREPKRPKYSRIKHIFLTANKLRHLESSSFWPGVVSTLYYVRGKWKNKAHEMLSLGSCRVLSLWTVALATQIPGLGLIDVKTKR